MTNTRKPVLLVDDDASFLEVMAFHLREEGYDVATAASGEAALTAFGAGAFPVVVTDLKMPGIDGFELLARLLALSPETLVIVITAFADVAPAVRAMKAGAFDFLPKPCDRDHFKLAVRRAFDHASLRREVTDLRRRLGSDGKELFFESEAMRRVVETADRVAASGATVLVLGESGTGKELLARRIHEKSPRAKAPFVAVNCGAVPASLLEAELFGHAKGAFTGAVREREGRFRQADGGTLFLDEIAELPPGLQTRLLRVLQERVVDAVGGSRPVPVDIRVIAAGAFDPAEAVRTGRLRQDLYFRLNVIALTMPPLRERPEDVVPLTLRFLARYAPERAWRISAAAEARLVARRWPGNVRELENLCQRIALLSDSETVSEDWIDDSASRGDAADMDLRDDVVLPPGGIGLEALEKAVIEKALAMNDNNRSRAARFLRIPRHVLLYRLEKYGIVAPGPRRANDADDDRA